MQNLIHKYSKYLYSQYWKGKPPKSPPTDECPRKLLSVPWALKPPLVFSTYHICPLLGLERPWPRPEPWGTDLLIGPCLLLSLAVSGILSRQQVWLGLEPKGQIPDLGSTHFWELPGLQPELLYSLTGHPYLLGLRCSACHRPREQTHDCWLCSLWGPRTWGWRQLFFFFSNGTWSSWARDQISATAVATLDLQRTVPGWGSNLSPRAPKMLQIPLRHSGNSLTSTLVCCVWACVALEHEIFLECMIQTTPWLRLACHSRSLRGFLFYR